MSRRISDEMYDVYLQERKDLIKAEHSMYERFDKAILTLSAGALGISVTFINQIAPNPKVSTWGWIFTAWLSFSLSILSTLISFLVSQKACRRQIEICEKVLLEKENSDQQNKLADLTQWFNYIAIVLFIIGIFALIIFCLKNLPFR
jgi:hypothetical protein